MADGPLAELMRPPRNPARAPGPLEQLIADATVNPLWDVAKGVGAAASGYGNAPEVGAGMLAGIGMMAPGRLPIPRSAAPVFAAEKGLGSGGRPPPKTYPTVDGGTVMEPKDAFSYARQIAEDAGFEIHGLSGQSNSLYLKKPGSDRVLRISDHGNYHPGHNPGGVVEARLTPTRDEVVKKWVDPIEGEIVEQEYQNVIRQKPDDIVQLISRAIAEYNRR